MAVTLVVVPLLSRSQHELGPGTVEVSLRSAIRGSTVLSFPPLGSVSAPTHRGPTRVTVELREIDVQPLLTGGGRLDMESLTASVREDLGPALRSNVLRIALIGAVVGAVAVLVLPHRRATKVLAGAVIGCVTATGSAAITLVGYDPNRSSASGKGTWWRSTRSSSEGPPGTSPGSAPEDLPPETTVEGSDGPNATEPPG